MRKSILGADPAQAQAPAWVLAGMIQRLGEPHFEDALLEQLHPLMPAASCSIYQTGRGCEPRLFMSASRGVPDTTRDCWRAYLSGPYLSDRTLASEMPRQDALLLCHITAQEVPVEHRAKVYEAHGVAERVSVVHQRADESVFAINFYRHQHQRPFSDSHLADLQAVAPALLAMTRKHIAFASPHWLCDSETVSRLPIETWRARLRQLDERLTARELDVCARLLQGMTQDGIAIDLGLGLPTVKTYRNRAFARLGIHFRNELFALLLTQHVH